MTCVFLFALSACSPRGSGTASAFRAAQSPIYSAAAFETGKLDGRWAQPMAFQGQLPSTCGEGSLEFTDSASGLEVNGRLCLDGQDRRVSGKLGSLGAGRLSVPGMEDWWVLWVDSDYRTLAVGTPSGAFGFILDRGVLPPDRLAAARAIFDFNGYRLEAMGPV